MMFWSRARPTEYIYDAEGHRVAKGTRQSFYFLLIEYSKAAYLYFQNYIDNVFSAMV
jgi:hypothetical protein